MKGSLGKISAFFVLTLALLTLFSCTKPAPSGSVRYTCSPYYFRIDFPQTVTVYDVLNLTEADQSASNYSLLKDFANNHNGVYLGMDNNQSMVYRVKVTSTDNSKQFWDFYDSIDSESYQALKEGIKTTFTDQGYHIVSADDLETDDCKYMKIELKGSHNILFYLTIKNGLKYTFSAETSYTLTEASRAATQKIFDSISFTRLLKNPANSLSGHQVLLITIAVAAALCVAVAIILAMRKKKKGQELREQVEYRPVFGDIDGSEDNE